jgi:hypothetical protein
MTIRVYLNDSIMGTDLFDQKTNSDVVRYSLKGVCTHLYLESGMYHMNLGAHCGVPKELEKHVAFFTLHDHISNVPREEGEYAYKSARATLRLQAGDKSVATLEAKAYSLDDLQILHSRILAGIITPKYSYQMVQGFAKKRKSREEQQIMKLEYQLSEARDSLVAAQVDAGELKSKYDILVEKLGAFDDLFAKIPFYRLRIKVANWLYAITQN